MKDNYRLIDVASWNRREHFFYYQNTIQTSAAVTVTVDVTELLSYAHRSRRKFYPCMVWAVSSVINKMDEMKMMLDAAGNPGIWDSVVPVYTVFHEKSHTFSDLWCDFHENLDDFYKDFVQTTEVYGHHVGIKGRPDQPENFYCISCVPWLDFDAVNVSASGQPPLFPIITYGKYTIDKEGRCALPFAIKIAHAAADGYHIAQFFEKLQAVIAEFKDR